MYTPTYNSEELRLFARVLDHVCIKLRVVDSELRTSIGKTIMFKAQTGERRFAALADYACLGRSLDDVKHKSTNDVCLKYQFSMIDPKADSPSAYPASNRDCTFRISAVWPVGVV